MDVTKTYDHQQRGVIIMPDLISDWIVVWMYILGFVIISSMYINEKKNR